MRALSAVLSDLIVFAEGVITRPNGNHPYTECFDAIASEIRHADALPAESVRTTRAAMVTVIAIEEFRRDGGEPGSRWLMLAGAALPMLRTEAWLALKNEKEARAG